MIPSSTLQDDLDSLMDYSEAGTQLHKHQWDLVHDPVAVLGIFEGDEDAASKTLFDSKYVRLHDDLGTTAWASTKEKDEFTQEIITEVDSKLEVLDKEDKKTYILFNYVWFDASNISTFEEKITNLSTNAKQKLEKELGISDFNLLVVVNAKYDAALSDGVKGVSFREWFYPMNGLDVTCAKAVKDYLNDVAKKKFTDGLNEALKERAEKLLEKLKGCKVEKSETLPKPIVSTNTNEAAKKAVTDVLTYKEEDDPSCNLCTRAALLNLKGDPVLFPKKGSYVFYTYDEVTDPVIKGEISGEGSALEIVNDFQNYQNNNLKDYFVEELKLANETYEQFWKRLQDKSDNGEVIIGVYKPKHVFMIVSGGVTKVVNNIDHTTNGKLGAEYKKNPRIEDGDKYGFSFAIRKIEYVPRILECGANIKSDNAPLYANMDFKGTSNINDPKNLRWFRYIK